MTECFISETFFRSGTTGLFHQLTQTFHASELPLIDFVLRCPQHFGEFSIAATGVRQTLSDLEISEFFSPACSLEANSRTAAARPCSLLSRASL